MTPEHQNRMDSFQETLKNEKCFLYRISRKNYKHLEYLPIIYHVDIYLTEEKEPESTSGFYVVYRDENEAMMEWNGPFGSFMAAIKDVASHPF